MADNVLEYLSDWKLMVCRHCEVGVFWECLVGHLVGKNHRMTRREAEEMFKEVKATYELVDEKDWVVVKEVVHEIDGLKKKSPGWRCIVNDCGYCCESEKTLEKHWATGHAGMKGKRGNRPKTELAALKDRKKTWCEKVMVQSFGDIRALRTCFRVEAMRDDARIFNRDGGERVKRELYEERKRMDENKLKWIRTAERGMEMIPWLKLMGWREYLEGFDRQTLLVLGSAPTADERLEMVIWKSLAKLLRFAEATVVGVNDGVRRHLRRTNNETRDRPFEPYRDRDEIEEKSRWWRRMVLVLVRNQGEDGVLKIRFDETERETFREMIQYGRNVVEDEGDLEVEDGEYLRDKRERARMERVEDERRERGIDRREKESLKVKVFGLDLRCLRFLMAMIRRKTNGHEYNMSMVCGLSVIGVNPSGWEAPAQFGPALSGILKCVRLVVLLECFQGEDVVEEGEQWKEDETFDLMSMVVNRMNEMVVRGTRGPAGWMTTKRAYAMKVGFETTAEGQLSWRDDGERVIYGRIEFTMDELRGMIFGLIAEGKRSLKMAVFGRDRQEDEFMKIDWDSLRDDTTRSDMGFSFLEDDRNRWMVDGGTWLMNKLVDEKRVVDEKSVVGGERTWNMKKAEAWLALVVKVKEWLLILTHLCCGQPARGGELLGMRWCSSGKAEGRNLFIEDGDVVSVLRDHKGSWNGTLKVILRFFPREVGELMVWYVWLVVRCAETVERRWRHRHNEPGSETEWDGSALIWGEDYDGKRWDANRLRKLMVRSFETGLHGNHIGIREWRHIVIGISRQHLRRGRRYEGEDEKDEKEGDDEEDDILDLQAGHSSMTAQKVYGRMIRERQGEVEAERAKFRAVSEEWFRFLKLSVSSKSGRKRGRTMRDEVLMRQEVMERREWLKTVNLDYWVKQAMGDGFELREKQREMLEVVKQGAERVLGVMKTGGGKSMVWMFWGLLKDDRIRLGMTVVVVPLVVLKDDLLHRCREMEIDAGEWNVLNQPVGKRVVVVVTETSLTSDFEDFLRRVKESGRLERIVIDEVHMVMNEDKTFRPALRRMNELSRWRVPMVMLSGTVPVGMEQRLLTRMDLTPLDVTVVRGETNRKELVWRRYDMQETDDDRKRDELEALVLRKKRKVAKWGGGSVLMYCGRVMDVKYWGERMKGEVYWSGTEQQKKLEVVTWLKKGTTTRGRDDRGKEEVRIVVGSSALGMGVDVKDIRVVIFAYEVDGMLDFVQGGGRAGRDGVKSEVVLVKGMRKMVFPTRGEGWQEMDRWVNGDECRRIVMGEYFDGESDRRGCRDGEEKCDICGDEHEMEDGLEVEGVELVDEVGEMDRRGEMNEYTSLVDDVGAEEEKRTAMERREIETRREAREEEERKEKERIREFEASERRLKTLADRSRQMGMNERAMVSKMTRWLEMWKGECVYCDDVSDDDDPIKGEETHSLSQCRRWKQNTELHNRVERDKESRWERFGGCFECGVWFGVCDRWVEIESDGLRSQGVGGGQWQKVNTGTWRCDLHLMVVWMVNWIGLNDAEWEREEQRRLTRMSATRNWRDGMRKQVQFGGIQCYEAIVMVMKYLEANRGGRGEKWFWWYYHMDKREEIERMGAEPERDREEE